ncbi:acyltransferase family protein [Metapseudomonas furukawaii]|uniref:O-antigen acetylase n=1 Tax=Metapseudomonas furukawaii TaxID=1149133 RepID=A0AAD1FHD6_METFU|nr:acyltransferase family protein [Pseudomonas furukawaii]ELS24018.1 O-antigen acetylase [Pseudomonas furukawaii]BAU75298.1 O-antigen acetylase [Pseudomonas furukawaii]
MNAASQSLSHSSLAYRPDVDGLRAVAIISVVLYHAFPFLLPGGFVGVDVFFVISGFLISSIIFKELEVGRFSFADFYRRRIRRIFPALILVLCVCYAIGWFTLMATDFKMLGKHLAGGMGFAQNIVLYREAGYFDTASELKPLLHLWSLGVEEQFYILFPVIAWGVWRWRGALLPVVLGLGVISFVAGVQKLPSNASAAFYVPQYRFWEILAGSLVAYWSVFHPVAVTRLRQCTALREALALLGFVLMGIALFVIHEARSFPGYWALLPVAGASLLIAAGAESRLNRVLLASRLMVWVGLISYPLYLWHWVVITYIRIIGADALTIVSGTVAIVLSVLLAFLTYRFVELPFRRARSSLPKTAILVSLGAMVAAVGMLSFIKSGLPFRPGLADKVKARETYAQYFENSLPEWAYFSRAGIFDAYRMECDFFDLESYRAGHKSEEPRARIDAGCYVPDTATKVMIWGDSHAQQFYYGLRQVLPDSVSILQVASSGCAANFPGRAQDGKAYCDRSNQFALEVIDKEQPAVLVIAQAYGHDSINSFVELARTARRAGVKRVIVVGPVPHYEPFLYQIVIRKHWNDTPRRIKDNLIQTFSELDERLERKYSDGAGGFEYLSAMRHFCNGEGCLIYLGDDRRTGLVTYDYGHLTPPASLDFAEQALGPRVMANLELQ